MLDEESEATVVLPSTIDVDINLRSHIQCIVYQ